MRQSLPGDVLDAAGILPVVDLVGVEQPRAVEPGKKSTTVPCDDRAAPV